MTGVMLVRLFIIQIWNAFNTFLAIELKFDLFYYVFDTVK